MKRNSRGDDKTINNIDELLSVGLKEMVAVSEQATIMCRIRAEEAAAQADMAQHAAKAAYEAAKVAKEAAIHAEQARNKTLMMYSVHSLGLGSTDPSCSSDDPKGSKKSRGGK